jgi:hypothetical protein
VSSSSPVASVASRAHTDPVELIHSGRYLIEQSSGNASGRNEHAIKSAVPAAVDRFHASLDELEKELQQAQAVLRRDLALRQADRLERERAEAAERQRLAAASVAKQSAAAAPKEAPRPKTAERNHVQANERMPAPTETSKPKAQPPAPQRIASPPLAIKTDTALPKERDPLFDPTPTTATAQDTDLDFDAMFGDTVNDGGADTGNNDQKGDVTMEDLNFNLDDGGGQSLLRGLEDFAKDGDDSGNAAQPDMNMDLDFDMPDLPDLSTIEPTADKPLGSTATQQAAANNNSPKMLDYMPTDSLEDLFSMDYDDPELMEASDFDNTF